MTSIAFALVFVALAVASLATVTGFGIGTLLTPIFALVYSTQLAVMLVAIVHFLSNLFRLVLFRRSVDLALVRRFGILSIVGALVGSYAQAFIQSDWLKVALGVLLIVLGGGGLLSSRKAFRLPRSLDQVGGLLSGLLGGLLGNQGALRSAYLANYDLPKESFIATAALIAVLIDATRIPVYLIQQWEEIVSSWPVLTVVTAGAFAGTLLGQRVIIRISSSTFRQLLNGLIVFFGTVMLIQGLSGV